LVAGFLAGGVNVTVTTVPANRSWGTVKVIVTGGGGAGFARMNGDPGTKK
jgi:hypothetical protein